MPDGIVRGLPSGIHCQSKPRPLPHTAQLARLWPPPRTVFVYWASPRQVRR